MLQVDFGKWLQQYNIRLRIAWQLPGHRIGVCASTSYWSVPGFKILPKAVGEGPEILRLHIRHLTASSAKTWLHNFTPDRAVLAAGPWEAEMQLAALLGKSGADTFLAHSRA